MSTTSTSGPSIHESHGAVGAETTSCRRSGFSPGRPRRSGHIVSSEEEGRASFLSTLLAASRKLYVYLHIDPESLNNAEFSELHPSICLGNSHSFACHSRFAILVNEISDERFCEVAA